MANKWTIYSEKEDAIINEHYEYGIRGSARKCQLYLPNRTLKSIQERASFLRYGGRNGKFWTDYQKHYLEKYAGLLPVNILAERIGKSEQAVLVYANHHNISLKYDGDTLKASELAFILGVDLGWVTRRVEQGVIKTVYKHDKDKAYYISRREVKRFFRSHPIEIDNLVKRGTKPDMIYFIEIIAGILKPEFRDDNYVVAGA